MSVNKNNRKENKALYLASLINLQKELDRLFKPIKNTYRDEYEWPIRNLMMNAIDEASRADSIFFNKYTTRELYRLREVNLANALGKVNTIGIFLTMLYEHILLGDDRLGNRAEVEAKFAKIGESVEKSKKLLRAVAEADKKKWKEFHHAPRTCHQIAKEEQLF